MIVGRAWWTLRDKGPGHGLLVLWVPFGQYLTNLVGFSAE